MKKKYVRVSIIVFLSGIFCLTSCHDHQKKTAAAQTQIIVAKMQTPVSRLYYSGTLLPIENTIVESEVAGIIKKVNFSYGERIVAGEKLIVISSKPLADDYRKAVNDFLKAKQDYVTGQTTFAGEKALNAAGVVAKNDYDSAQADYDNKVLAFYQAQYTLEKVLRKAHLDPKSIESLTLADTTRVNDVLRKHFHNVEVNAPVSGIALFPTANSGGGSGSDGGDSSSGLVAVGASVKAGQLLLTIGNLTGLSATFNVSEVDIDRIHKGMSVIVTGSAFPDAQLKGVVTAVSSQAEPNSSGGMSMFAANIQIPNIDPKILEKIRVGMSAKFEIDITGAPHIMLPVVAVFQQNGQSMVTIRDAAGMEKSVPVITGATTPTDVVIIKGVNAGDKVVIHDQA